MKTFLHIGMSALPDFHAVGLKTSFEANGWKYIDVNTSNIELNRIIIDYANAYKPELVWIQIQAPGISKESIEALKAVNSFIVQWSGDMRHRLPECYFHYMEWGCDLATFSNMTDVNIMRNCGYDSEFLQIGASPEIYNTTGPVNSICEIAFFGNTFSHFPLSGLRRDMVKQLKLIYGDKFKAFGHGQPDGNYNGDQNGEAAVYRGAKIGINLSHFDAPRYTSDRLMRMLLCGVCVLSHNYKGIEQDFMHGENILVWDDLHQLKKQIDIILSDPIVGKRIANKGHELALSRHTFAHMAQDILNLYNQYNG